jgi:uncharacterized repeat protein (TIGR01451 family)
MNTYNIYQGLFSEQLGSSDETIQFTIAYGADFNGDGFNDIKVTLKVAEESNSGTEDMIGVAFDIGNDSLISSLGLNITGITTNLVSPEIQYIIGQNVVTGNFEDVNIAGGGVDAPYDVAIQFNKSGQADGVVQEASFLITSVNNSLDGDTVSSILNNTDWYVRLQSTDGGEESAKTGGFIHNIDGSSDPDPDNFVPSPSLAIDKVTNSADGLEILAGTDITWTYSVSNTGNVGLSNISVSDDQGVVVSYVGGDADNDGILDIDEVWTYEGQGQAITGDYQNIGTVTGSYTDSLGKTTIPTASDISSYFGAAPSLVLDKVASFTAYNPDFPKANVGDVITYTFIITNDGNVALNDISLSDALITNGSLVITSGLDADQDGDIDSLGAGETATFSATYTVTDADAAATQVVNTATVNSSYTDDLNTSVSPTSSDTEVVIVNRPPDAVDNSYIQPKTQTSVIGNVITDNTGEGLDSDPDGDPLSIANYDVESVFGGTVIMNTDGSFTYTSVSNFAGYDQFEYTISDGLGGFDTATVYLEVQTQNQRSIEMSNMTASLKDIQGQTVSANNVVSGTFDITNASSDPGLQVQLVSFDVSYQQKSLPNGKGKWIDVDPLIHVNQFWVDTNADGLLNGEETLLTDINAGGDRFQSYVTFEDTITIGYTSTFINSNGDPLNVPDPLRVTASTEIYGRDRIFSFSDSF